MSKVFLPVILPDQRVRAVAEATQVNLCFKLSVLHLFPPQPQAFLHRITNPLTLFKSRAYLLDHELAEETLCVHAGHPDWTEEVARYADARREIEARHEAENRRLEGLIVECERRFVELAKLAGFSVSELFAEVHALGLQVR